MIAWWQAAAPLAAVEKAAGSPWVLGVLGGLTVILLTWFGRLMMQARDLLTSLAHTLHGTKEEQESGTSHGLIATVQAMKVSLEETASELRETRIQTRDELREAASSRETSAALIGRAIDAIAVRQELSTTQIAEHQHTLDTRYKLWSELKSDICAVNARIDALPKRGAR